MADAAKSSNVASDGGSDSGTNEESVDQDFDITADMMVHDMDDETTLEEEEKLDNKENFSEEIADLEKEGDMPLEDLLAMYGYHSDESETQAPDEPVTKTDVLPPLISARQAIQDPDLPNQSEKEDSIPLEDASPVPSPLMQEQSDYAPSPQSNNNQNNVFPENQRITRGLLAAYSYFNLGESSSSDDDDEYNPEEWKKEIHIGEEHQAVVPEGLNTEKEYTYDGVDKCLWNPSKINEQELQRYLNSVCKPPGADIQREVKRDDEQALYMLLQCSYDVSEAVRRQKSQTKPQAEMALWSEEECRDFESGLRIYGKDFLQIQQNKVTSRSVNEIVQFYYLWKKTERHDAYASQSRLAKKKYTFHPGITDYMDRFLDENESAESFIQCFGIFKVYISLPVLKS
ncbi:mesoderm induction early response protein 1 isoform X2 [Nematostella vectensis]|uniref:mesoderm induction early response protein 1 isoform X2 n=1 Tax=Nematostella vectensis TaxID=45351 RepID=UPI0020778FF4|nr:mesoderm induction early response protein 1 isoform X2 [Nematostella vectensis]